MLLASAGFAGMGALVKHTAALGVPPTEIVAWRSGVTALCIGAWALRVGAPLRPVNAWMHLTRGLVGVTSMALYFTAIGRLPLGDAVLLTYLSPILVAAMSPWVTGERASGRTWAALLLGLVGVGLVVGPSARVDALGVAAGLAAAFFAADAYLAVRVLTRTDGPLAIVFWFSIVGTLAGTLSFLDGIAAPTPERLAFLLPIGGVGALAQWALTRAYAAGPAARVAVWSYATPVFAYVAGLLFGEVPQPVSLVGVLTVVAAGWLAST